MIEALKLLAAAYKRNNERRRIYFDFVREAGRLDAEFRKPENVTKRFDNLRATG